MSTAGEVLMTDFKTFGEACLALIENWSEKDDGKGRENADFQEF